MLCHFLSILARIVHGPQLPFIPALSSGMEQLYQGNPACNQLNIIDYWLIFTVFIFAWYFPKKTAGHWGHVIPWWSCIAWCRQQSSPKRKKFASYLRPSKLPVSCLHLENSCPNFETPKIIKLIPNDRFMRVFSAAKTQIFEPAEFWTLLNVWDHNVLFGRARWETPGRCCCWRCWVFKSRFNGGNWEKFG